MFRTDRGGEFISHEFQSFCEKYGIKRQLTAPYSPQQNGVVERRNRTLLEMTRSLLKHMKCPNYLWGEAVRHATYLINRLARRSLNAQTPYELFKGKKPNLEHLRVFGCINYARTKAIGRKKLDDRSKILVHLGTEPGSKAYRLMDPTNRKIIISRDVVFDEDKIWKWNGQGGENDKEDGTFVLRFGEFGNKGIRRDFDVMETVESDQKVRVISEDSAYKKRRVEKNMKVRIRIRKTVFPMISNPTMMRNRVRINLFQDARRDHAIDQLT
ncbi:Retrovirus-related Pol polyprotein from transposon TNT 1-94 [Cardamine amara subsp. amara]|uniref:Retrovirus-related Pol polyprotein from transposon TNT 1-94 n=1 Tax=Cardamine amara subsp. amara TaxID=228776 RepID=A0ABD1BQK8_CARAN